jgi:mannose-6-phosphate isomerase-like protein (cupin superfamily)
MPLRIAPMLIVTMAVSAAAAQVGTPQRRARVQPMPTHLIVRDVSGTPIEGVNVTIDDSGSQPVVTDAKGMVDVMLGDGTRRLRLERDGFITLEREVTIRAGKPSEVYIVLSTAPAAAAPPEPPPPPPPPEPEPAPAAIAAGPPVHVSVPAFLDRNFIGREASKQTVLACMPGSTTRLLQLRDPLAAHKHDDVDEIVYVVAGEGAIRIGGQSTLAEPGSLSVIPRGVEHSIERRGNNPLILLSSLAGEPCVAPTATESSVR